MSYFEEDEDASPLSGFQRFLLGMLYWPVVIFACLAVLVSRVDGGTMYLSFWTTLIFVIGGYIAAWIWKFLRRGKWRALIAGLALCAFYAVPVLGLIALPVELSGLAGDEAGGGRHDESHLVYGVASTSGDGVDKNGFSICIEEVHRVPDGRRSMRQEGLDVLRGTASPEMVEDSIQDVIVAVCEKFEAGRVELLRPYFFKAVKNQERDLRQEIKNRLDYCRIDEVNPPGPPDARTSAEIRLLQAAMCRLDDRKAYAIRRKADGHSHEEIAEELDISTAHSRRLVSDGRAELRQLMERLSRR